MDGETFFRAHRCSIAAQQPKYIASHQARIVRRCRELEALGLDRIVSRQPADPAIGTHRRVVIENVAPEIDEGRVEAKRVVGETVVVEADIFCDGHDALSAVVWRRSGGGDWSAQPMALTVDDRWRGVFEVIELGPYFFTIEAWVDRFGTWRNGVDKKIQAGTAQEVDLVVGAELAAAAAARAERGDARSLGAIAALLADSDASWPRRVMAALSSEFAELSDRYPDRSASVTYRRELPVHVDRLRARYGSWYEMFPRSTSPDPDRAGTLADATARLDYVAAMNFDVVYLPPVHPIGHTKRKGRNGSVTAADGDVGSPWAIGDETGGHKAIHPELGTEADFIEFVERAHELRIDVAIDLAFQCSPDHPWITEHPDWFHARPDGTLQFAENPPKRYEDIYPLDFESADSERLWLELCSVVDCWIERGVTIFRVDNPHTKSFAFWQWLIRETQRSHPEIIFLAEAFTRPSIMHKLAKIGFTQSYTYFTWRYQKWEIEQYFTELCRSPSREYFRPNVWPNTPDITSEYLQYNGRAGFMIRIVLATTLAANYGIYGPVFELGIAAAREPGLEEYADSEKYEVRHWNLDECEEIREVITRLNHIRRAHPALQQDWTLTFHEAQNDQIVAYSKTNADRSDVILCVVNVDPTNRHEAMIGLDLDALGLSGDRPFVLRDLIGGGRYVWNGPWNYVELDPVAFPAHVFAVDQPD